MFLGNPPIKSPLSSIFFAQRSSEKDTRQRGFYRGITYEINIAILCLYGYFTRAGLSVRSEIK